MRARTFMPVALACALLVSVGATADASTIVYGNLGPNGTGTLSDSGSDFGPSAASLKVLAQGFTTGATSTSLQVTSVSLGAFYDNFATENLTVSIYGDASGNPGGTPLFTSSPTPVGAKGTYAFSFSNAVLAANTSYWIVPQSNEDWFWYLNIDESQPVEQNDSGYVYFGTGRSSGDISGPWSSTSQPYAVSINAINPVPEPSAVALAGVGIVVAGLSYRRRLRRAAVTKADDAT